MSTDASAADPPEQPANDDRYAALHLADEELVVYDLSNNQAWVQSDLAVSLKGML